MISDDANDQVLEAAAHEARAVAVGAGEQVTRAGLAVRGGLMSTFLPAGYPASVRPEYVRYRSWDILQVSRGFHSLCFPNIFEFFADVMI